MKRKHIITLILMILVPIIFFKLRDFGLFNFDGIRKQKRCTYKEKALEMPLHGEIVNKYEDKENHNIRTLIIKDRNGASKRSIILAVDGSGLYNKLKIGDYISKDAGELMVVVESNSQKDSIMLDYDCEDDN